MFGDKIARRARERVAAFPYLHRLNYFLAFASKLREEVGVILKQIDYDLFSLSHLRLKPSFYYYW